MNSLQINNDGSSTLPIDELLAIWPDRFVLLCNVVSKNGSPELAGKIAERDPVAGRKFLARLDVVYNKHQCPIRRANNELFRGPVISALARAKARDILGEIDDQQ